MNTFTTTSVEATLGRKLITRADQFFSHSKDCIIDEMIQNSRRAGALAESPENQIILFEPRSRASSHYHTVPLTSISLVRHARRERG